MSQFWNPTDPGCGLDARCSGLYLSLAKLSEIAESGNAVDYNETATIFIGLSVMRLIESDGIPQSEAERRVAEEVKQNRDRYWQRLVRAGKTGQPDPVLDSDIPFCLKRGDFHASETFQ